MWKVSSPSGNVEIVISLNQESGMQYTAYSGDACCGFGSLGIDTNLASFTQNLTFSFMEEPEEINETYKIPAGKKDVYENHCLQTRLHFMKGDFAIALEVRAYDNGAAFRYIIPEVQGEEIIEVKGETTDFCFPAESKDIWLQELVPTYEAPYVKYQWEPELSGQRYGMPSLTRIGERGPWVMINEAGVLNHSGEYSVSHLVGTDDRSLRLEFALEENGQAVPAHLPLTTPWRYMLIAETLDEVVCSTLNYNLNPPSDNLDTSWIKPARALWQWWISDTGPQVYTEVIEYIDFAAAMGFEAVVVDAGWDESWIAKLCTYAHAKGVSLWLWTAMADVSTKEKAEHLFPLWKSWGIDGVKVDCIENDSAQTAGWYQMTAQILEREKMMVNYHGCTKPMGEGRTWPHFVAAEGIMGLEYYKWSNLPDALHNCTAPFIRNAVGPMDYTPVGFSNKNRNTSMAHQMALAAVFESGYTHYAASIYNLEAWKGTDFLRRLKPKYDGLRLLSGYPGDHVAMLRWTDASKEYVIGCICNTKRTLELELNFLEDGEYEAELYLDDRFGERVMYSCMKVNAKTVLTIPMVLHGGAGVYIARKIKPLENRNPTGYMTVPLSEHMAAEGRALQGSTQGTLSDADPTRILTLNGEAEFLCRESITPGLASIRLFYRSSEDCLLRISDGISEIRERIPASGEMQVLSAHTVKFSFSGGPADLIFERLLGGPVLLEKIQIIENAPVMERRIAVETAELFGNGVILPDLWGGYQLTGADQGTVIRFNNVMLSEAGEYIIRVNYYAASTGTSWIHINGNEGINAKLNGVGKWNSTKEGELLKREILGTFNQGENTIEITADEPLPPIKELILIKLKDDGAI